MCFAWSYVFTLKYVGSFPVDDCCLDDQMEQLHTQLKSLKVSPEPPEVSWDFHEEYNNKHIVCLQLGMQEKKVCIPEILH